jgi:cytolysin-activating lysine-acyltransferase
MQQENIDILAPQFEAQNYDPMRVLGQAAWLWTRSQTHYKASTGLLHVNVIPAIEHGQFMLGSQVEQPLFWTTWALLSDDAQARFLKNPNLLQAADWRSGEHIWFIDWVSPFSRQHVALMRNLLRQWFAGKTMRSIDHRSSPGAFRVRRWHGSNGVRQFLGND